MTLGQKIRASRLERRLTQEQLGGRELSKSYISELERGHRTPRLATLQILARRLKRPLSYFLEGVTEDQEAEALLMVGLAHFHGQSLTEAAAWFKRASEALSDERDELLHARTEIALALLEQRLGHHLRAWRRAERVLPVLARAGDRPTLVRAHLCVGRAKLAAGDSSSAAWTFEAGLRLLPKAESDPTAFSSLCYYLGIARQSLGQTMDAVASLQKAAEVAECYADPVGVGAWRLQCAVEAAEGGLFEIARGCAGEAIAVYDTLEHKRRLAEIHWHLGDLEAAADRWREARRHFAMSVVLYRTVRPDYVAARRLVSLVEMLRERKPPEVVRAIGEIVLALFPDDFEPGTNDENRAGTLWLRGTIERLLGHGNVARVLLTESLNLFVSFRRTDDIRNIRRELALLAVESDDLPSAREYLTALAETGPSYHLTSI